MDKKIIKFDDTEIEVILHILLVIKMQKKKLNLYAYSFQK